jgi:pimeloyl-ACP methyl ester carboxylesterase
MVAICILIPIFLAVLALLLYRMYLQLQVMKKSKRLIADGGVSSVEEVMLGGVKQCILIQAKDVSKPVLLFLHGGPGMPFPGVGCRGVDWILNITTTKLIDQFTVVYWDQRGTGKSYSTAIDESSMNVEQFVSDANELTDLLRCRFGTDKIFLAGVSWVSIIGIQLADRYPEKFHAYIGIAQIVNWVQSDKIAYDWLLKRAVDANNRKAIVELAAIGSPPYIHDVTHWNLLRKWLMTMGGLIHQDGQIRHPGLLYVFKKLLQSPDYTMGDLIRTFHKGMKLAYSRRMLADFSAYDAMSKIRKLEMPVYFFHGEHDRAIPGKLLESFYEQLEAPRGKQLTWLPDSAHLYSLSDSRLVEQRVIEFAGGTL